MFSMLNRGKMPQAVQSEFEHLFAKLKGFLSQTFDEDGDLIVADPNLAIFGVGDIKPTAAHTPQAGWVMCDGSQLNRATYKSLFDVIGIEWGAGDGSTTFSVPDLRQRFLLGKAASGTGNSIGSTGGAIDHTHTGGTLATTVSLTTSSSGTHGHTVDSHQHNISSDGSHTHTYSGTVAVTDAGSTFNAGPGGVPVTTDFHQHAYSGTTSADGSHNHGGATSSTSPGTSSDGAHTHTVSGSTSSVTGTTASANPPYAVVNFMIFAGV